jgi:hypothetical protein
MGGYTPLAWCSDNDFHGDITKKSFIFSITANKKFKTLIDDNTIFCSPRKGPIFG